MPRGFLLGLAALAVTCALAADAPPRPIVCTEFRDHHTECIRTMLPDGTVTATVTDGEPDAYMAEMNRQGTLVAYCRAIQGFGTEIFVAKPDGADARMITRTGSNYHPSFSPDGARLVYHSTRGENRELYTIALDGAGETRITDNGAEDREPVWGPDGRIYFQSDRDGHWEVYRVDADGANPLRLTRAPEGAGQPAISPDGTMIAFTRWHTGLVYLDEEGDVGEVYVMAADGTGTRLVTPGTAASHASFSPDGRRLVYQEGELYFGRVRLINLDGTGDAPVGPDRRYSPTWGK